MEAVQDGELWRLWYTVVPSPEKMQDEIKRRLDLQHSGLLLPFAVIDNKTRKAVGMTTYCTIDASSKRLDIGWTWYQKSVQRTAINTECKLMLLTHAFETLKCIAVGYRVNSFNLNSRRAVERLGAKFDGIMRNFRVMPNGTVCDFYMYSTTNSEWPTVKINLQWKLEQYVFQPIR
jgi:RimJ/RimL family protein N-acetyltransferase